MYDCAKCRWKQVEKHRDLWYCQWKRENLPKGSPYYIFRLEEEQDNSIIKMCNFKPIGYGMDYFL